MPEVRIYNQGGVNLFINPLLKDQTEPLRAINVDTYPYGAKTKRPGYVTFLGTADGSTVNSLFSWQRANGTEVYVYRASGTALWVSYQGTGEWTAAGGITSASHVQHAVLDDKLFIADGGTVKFSTTGTSFVAGTLAPAAIDVVEYQNRIYAAGTASTLFYSSAGDGTNWNTSGTSDSSSFTIPGEGKLLRAIKVSDRLVTTKNSGVMHKWDGYQLSDMANSEGPTSPYSLAEENGYYFWLNYEGIYGFGGNRPELISNPIQPQFYNNSGSAMLGSLFSTTQAAIHKHNYYVYQGTVTDDITYDTIKDSIAKYDIVKNQYTNYQFYNTPNAMHSYTDTSGVRNFIFSSGNQCYKISGTALSDNGNAIPVNLLYQISTDLPEFEKEFKEIDLFFNPGNQANVAYAVGNTFNPNSLKWKEIGDCSQGHVSYRFPTGTRGRLMFIRIYESSTNSQFKFYGMTIDYDFVKR